MGVNFKEIAKKLKEQDAWCSFASKCKESYQKYHGAPSPLPTCKLTNNACRYENCPKRKGECGLVKQR